MAISSASSSLETKKPSAQNLPDQKKSEKDGLARSMESLVITSPFRRLLAAIIDAAVIGLIGVIVFSVVLIFVLSALSQQTLTLIVQYVVFLLIISVLLLVWFYLIYLLIMTTLTKGGTIGKQALSMRIVKSYGVSIGFGTVFGRELLKMVFNFLPFLHLIVIFHPKHQGLHDIVARTLVVDHDWPRKKMMKIIGIASIPLFIIGLYAAEEWTAWKTAQVLNQIRTNIFQDINSTGSNGGKTLQGDAQEIFYANLYNGTHNDQEIIELKKQFEAGAYNDSIIASLFTRDADLDGLSDELEKKYQTNPYSQDTDADGKNDQLEIEKGASPIGLQNSPLTATNTNAWQVLNEQDFQSFISYPIGWGFRKNDVGDYSFAPLQENGELGDALIALNIKRKDSSDILPFRYKYPGLYQNVSVIRPFQVNSVSGEILRFPLDVRLAIMETDQLVIQVIEILPDELEAGTWEGFVSSFQQK